MFFREGLKRLYNMLTAEDKVLLAGKGITEEQIEAQLQTFKKGFPFLKLKAAASLAHGILAPSAEECRHYEEVWKLSLIHI